MYILKSCPKCHGDLSVEQDEFSSTVFNKDTDFACLQCGYRLLQSERREMLVRIKTWYTTKIAAARVSRPGGAVPAM